MWTAFSLLVSTQVQETDDWGTEQTRKRDGKWGPARAAVVVVW
jgi:hypothetical protein